MCSQSWQHFPFCFFYPGILPLGDCLLKHLPIGTAESQTCQRAGAGGAAHATPGGRRPAFRSAHPTEKQEFRGPGEELWQPGGMQAGTERARLGTGPGKTQQGRALPKKRRGAALPGLWASARRGPQEQPRGTRPATHSGVASAPCSPSAAHLRCRPGLKLHQKQTRPQTARLEREFKHKGQENGNRLSVLFQGGPRTVFHTRSRLWRGVRKAGPAGAVGRHGEGSPRHSAAAVGVLAPPTSAVSRLQQLAGEGFQKGAHPGGLRPPFLLGTAGPP